MIEVVDTLNTFASKEAAQPPEQVFVLTSSQLEAIIRSATAPLTAKIEVLEARQNAYSDQEGLVDRERYVEKEIRALNVKLEGLQDDLKKYHVWTNVGRVEDLLEWVEDLDNKLSRQQALHIGKKTESRIKTLKAILKTHGGARAFGELLLDLGLSPSQFSQLVKRLDMRVFEIVPRPHSKTGEKILKLRRRLE